MGRGTRLAAANFAGYGGYWAFVRESRYARSMIERWSMASSLVFLSIVGIACSSTKPAVGDAGPDGAAVLGDGSSSGEAGKACGGADFVSCLVVDTDGSGECQEGSGFAGPQKQLFEQTCQGTLSTKPCSRAYPNVGGCSRPANYCWVVWGLIPNDPSTPEDEFADGKAEYPKGCAMIGGTYILP